MIYRILFLRRRPTIHALPYQTAHAVSQMAIIDMIYLNIIRSDFKKYSSYMDEAETLFIKYR